MGSKGRIYQMRYGLSQPDHIETEVLNLSEGNLSFSNTFSAYSPLYRCVKEDLK